MKKNVIDKILSDQTDNIDLFDVKQYLLKHPYIEILRLIYLRELKKRDTELFERELKDSSCFISDRKFAYKFINGNANSNSSLQIYDSGAISADYFALESAGTTNESLRQLARKLKKARLAKIEAIKDKESSDNIKIMSDDDQQKQIRQLIEKRRYREALQMMKKINFSNSEKSVYFALQMKYLETILGTHS